MLILASASLSANERLQQQKSAYLYEKPTTRKTEQKLPWLEELHESVASSVFYSAQWFDNFFTDNDMGQLAPKTNLRVRLSWIPKKDDWNTFDSRFRLSVKLPHFQNKLDLVFSDDETIPSHDSDLRTIPENTDEDFDSLTAAFRYIHNQQLDALFDSRLGVSGNGIFYRTRYKKRFSWQEKHSAKFEPSIYYFLTKGFGAKLVFEYNYHKSALKQYQLSTSFKRSTTDDEINWGQGIHKYSQLSHHSASLVGLQLGGIINRENYSEVSRYAISYKYRINALRKWLFFEVEPFYEWLSETNYHPTPGIALRVEGYFSRQ